MKKSTIILIAGIIAFLIGTYQTGQYETAIKNGYEVDAIVTKVEINKSSDVTEDDTYVLYGDYEVGGKEYKNKRLYTTTKEYHKGDTYKLVVNPENPDKKMPEGALFSIGGFIMIVVAIVNKRKEKKAQQSNKEEV